MPYCTVQICEGQNFHSQIASLAFADKKFCGGDIRITCIKIKLVYRQFVENHLWIRSKPRKHGSFCPWNILYMHYYNSLLIACKCFSYPYSHYMLFNYAYQQVNQLSMPMPFLECKNSNVHTLKRTHPHDYVTGDGCSLLIFSCQKFCKYHDWENVIITIKNRLLLLYAQNKSSQLYCMR